MEIRNHATNMQMCEPLNKALQMCRERRAFDVESWVEAKINLLNAYYRQAGLKSAVVAVSGGIDSAVVLGLVSLASQAEDSPIERIEAITMPALTNDGVTGQEEAGNLALKVCQAFNIERGIANLAIDPVVDAITQMVEGAIGLPHESKERWCRGQVVSYARTPIYYYVTSVLSAQGQPGLIIGTTNLSEGGYLGYFGKASDGMVDVQLISDIYKSEVYEVGRFLGVPEEVLNRAPTGDMFDATTDEVVFGAPYDFVELYIEYTRAREREDEEFIYDLLRTLTLGEVVPAARGQWEEYAANLERMHSYNAHKYLGRSPAVHLDIMGCGVKAGWDNPAWRPE